MADRCNICGSTTVWWAIVAESGRAILMEKVAHPRGNVVIVSQQRDGTNMVHVLVGSEHEHETRPRWLPHKACCGKDRPPDVLPEDPNAGEQLDIFATTVAIDAAGAPHLTYQPKEGTIP